MIATFFRVRFSGKRTVCVRFGIADPEVTADTRQESKGRQTASPIEDDAIVPIRSELHCLGNSTVANKPIDSLRGSGRFVGHSSLIMQESPVTRAQSVDRKG